MVFPLIIHIADMTISVHQITDIVSILVGGIIYWQLSKNDGISAKHKEYLLIGAGLGVLIGSRLVGSLENPTLFFHPPLVLYYYVSKTIIGGIAGGILGMEAAKLIIGHKSSTGDAITIPLAVAIIIGRIGCLLTGVTDGTVGNPCNFLWCFNQGDGIARHPTSLYEILFLSILLVVYYLYLKKKTFVPGVLFRSFITLYFAFRFIIEFIKPTHSLAFGLSAIQIVCFLYIIWYIYDTYRILRKNTYDHKRSN